MNQPKFRPPIISAALAAGLGWVTHWCYRIGQMGHGWGTAAALLAGGLTLHQLIRCLNDRDKLKIYHKRLRDFQQSAKDQGQAHFETLKNIKAAGLLVKRGVFGGVIRQGRKKHYVRFDSENSGLWLGPPGSWKTAASIIPTALTDPGTQLINDPSCEILAVTEPARQRMGNETSVLTSSPNRVQKIVGREINAISINVYSTIDFSGNPGTVRSEVAFRSKLWIPQRHDEDDKSRFFRADGREILDFIALYLAAGGHDVNLPAIRRILLSGPDQMADMFSECINSSAFGGVLAEIANGLLLIKMDAPEQFAGGYGVAKQAINWADHYSEVGSVLSHSSFDVSRIKGDKPVTIYFCLPGELAEIYQPFANAMLSYLWRVACNDPRQNTVTCLLDEVIGLGYLPLFHVLEEGRKYRVRTYCAFQETVGQIEQVYGKPGVRRILAAAELIWASGVREPETLQMLSRLAGSKASRGVSMHDRATFAANMPERTHAKSSQSVPLLRPEDIRTLPFEKALVLYRNLHPILLDKCLYFKHPAMKRLAGPNPYYGGKK